MNYREMLLTLLIEECAEVSQRATKIQRFGLLEVQPGQTLTNELRLIGEVNDLIAVLMKVFEVDDINKIISPTLIQDKIEKIKKYLDYSIQCGTLNSIEDVINTQTPDSGSPYPTADPENPGRSEGIVRKLPTPD
jgi:hypothetical protein